MSPDYTCEHWDNGLPFTWGEGGGHCPICTSDPAGVAA